MNPVYSTLHLDLQHKTIESVSLKQYDQQSRFIVVNITDNGSVYNLTDDISAEIKIHKPDGTNIVNSATVDLSNNHISVPITEQMTVVFGVLDADISIYKSNVLLSTMPFHLNIEKSPVQKEDVISSDEYGVLEDLISAERDAENVRIQNENLRKDAENARKNNENDRASNENERKSNENDRKNNESQRIENEATRQTNETIRENQEVAREEKSKTAVENANNAATNANEKANDLQEKLDSHYFLLMEDLLDSINSSSVLNAATSNSVKMLNDKLESLFGDVITNEQIDSLF